MTSHPTKAKYHNCYTTDMFEISNYYLYTALSFATQQPRYVVNCFRTLPVLRKGTTGQVAERRKKEKCG